MKGYDMTENELRNQELNRHMETVDRNIEHQQTMNLGEKKRGIAAANQNSAVARIVKISYFLFGALELLLAVRVVLYLVGANAGNSFANFINVVSSPFVSLFATLLQNPMLGTTGVLEITTIIGMIVWGIIAWLIARLIWLVGSRPR
jgi:YggT family protein